MTSSSSKSAYWRGFRGGLPFVIVVVPFALLFGLVATEAGLSVAETMGFSVLIIAGAAQFAAVQLMVENAPTLAVIATALAVNLRMAMYSASLVVHLGAAPLWKRALVAYLNVDQSYAVSIAEYERRPDMALNEKLAFFVGAVSPVFPLWYLMSYLGARFADAIPPDVALDFAVPITFLAVVAPMLRTLAHIAAALTSVVVALVLYGLPAGTGLLLAGVLAMMVGARVELWQERAR